MGSNWYQASMQPNCIDWFSQTCQYKSENSRGVCVVCGLGGKAPVNAEVQKLGEPGFQIVDRPAESFWGQEKKL